MFCMKPFLEYVINCSITMHVKATIREKLLYLKQKMVSVSTHTHKYAHNQTHK